jgi:molybdate transport system substrate-binding protein
VPSLLTQLESGVPGDVLVTPDATTMAQAASRALLGGEPEAVGRSVMGLVVPAGNPAGVADVTALSDGGLRVTVCAVELPCGKLAQQLADRNGFTLAPDSLEPGGSPGIVTKASTGEIDVGLVFATDVAAGGSRVELVPLPDDQNVSSELSAATTASAGNPVAAAAFVDLLRSPAGVDLVTAAGFRAP